MVMKNGVGIHHQNKKHLFVYFFTMDSFVAEKLVKLGIDDEVSVNNLTSKLFGLYVKDGT
jgi:hypothetical protein